MPPAEPTPSRAERPSWLGLSRGAKEEAKGNASRSDDNPNGFTIEGFTIIENKDLQTIKR